MKYIALRGKDSKFTIHATECSVVIKHYAAMKCFNVDTIAEETVAGALETVAEVDPNVTAKVCKCAR